MHHGKNLWPQGCSARSERNTRRHMKFSWCNFVHSISWFCIFQERAFWSLLVAWMPVCAACGSVACVQCCGEDVCLTHAHASRHGSHPSSWSTTNRAEYSRTAPAVAALCARIVAEIERDLEAAMHVASSSSVNIAPAPAPPPQTMIETSFAPKPSLPTFSELRRRAAAQAARKEANTASALAASSAAIAAGSVSAAEAGREFDAEASTAALEAAAAAGTSRVAESDDLVEIVDESAARPTHPDGGGAAFLFSLPSPRKRPREDGGVGDGPIMDASAAAIAGRLKGSFIASLTGALRAGLTADFAAAQQRQQRLIAVAAAAVAAPSVPAAEAAARGAVRERDAASLLNAGALGAIAVSIEAAVRTAAAAAGNVDEYRRRARVLALALADNGNARLRARLLSGALTPAALSMLPEDELAPPPLQAARAEDERRRAQGAEDPAAGLWSRAEETLCPACGACSLETLAVHAERDARKAEIWGGGGSEGGERWRVRCRACGDERIATASVR